MNGFRLVRFDDWEALYDTSTGAKIIEGHRIDARDLLREINADCDVKSASPEFDSKTACDGYVPENLGEYPEGAFE